MAESGFFFNSATSALEHMTQDEPDYDEKTFTSKTNCLENIAECKFSYSDGTAWKDTWSKDNPNPPRIIKIDFKFKEEDKAHEFIVNIPVSQ